MSATHAVDSLGWAVTELDGTTIVYQRDELVPRIFDYWQGTRRLWRVDAGGRLLSLRWNDYEHAEEARPHA